jgi:hypothetical protein
LTLTPADPENVSLLAMNCAPMTATPLVPLVPLKVTAALGK